MKSFIADLHIHSRFSMATSKQLCLPELDYWARLKGITVLGSGDFTHPLWFKEIKEQLIPSTPGLFKLKSEFIRMADFNNDIHFMLTAEISSIYKKNSKVRKIHNLLLAPDFETVEKIQKALAKIGNIVSDGRPILGLDARDLLEIVLQANQKAALIPAHIWTPWFSMLGTRSGFDNPEECFEDLTPYIFAVETGLSSDPLMNRCCDFLDRFTLISNSDAHSSQKLGRNANIFSCNTDYYSMIEALKNPTKRGFEGTIDMFPQEGKYYLDGHRKCRIKWTPEESTKNNKICPVCGKPVTTGVLNRVNQLATRNFGSIKNLEVPFRSVVPLKEILAEYHAVNEKSKKVENAYMNFIKKAGSEFNLLLHLSMEELEHIIGDELAAAILRMRKNEVSVEEGFDGQFGKIKLFA